MLITQSVDTIPCRWCDPMASGVLTLAALCGRPSGNGCVQSAACIEAVLCVSLIHNPQHSIHTHYHCVIGMRNVFDIDLPGLTEHDRIEQISSLKKCPLPSPFVWFRFFPIFRGRLQIRCVENLHDQQHHSITQYTYTLQLHDCVCNSYTAREGRGQKNSLSYIVRK